MANVVNGIQADHHKYVIADRIDPAVVAQQSRIQLEKRQETSVVHHHRAAETCKGREHDFYGVEPPPHNVVALPS